MRQLGFTGRMAAWSANHAKLVIAAWVVLAVVISAASSSVGQNFTTDIRFTSKPDSQVVRDRLLTWQGDAAFESLVISSDRYPAQSPQFETFVGQIVQALRQHPEAIAPTSIVSAYEVAKVQPEAAGALFSRDGKSTLVSVQLLGDLEQSKEGLATMRTAVEPFRANTDFRILQGGFTSANEAFTSASEKDLSSEVRVLPIALLILVAVFGAVVAALVPMGVGIVAIMVTFGVVALISQLWALSVFVSNIVTMIGLAVGIDYALLLIARYREERQHRDLIAAITAAGDTANRAVLFSGGTVVIALTGMIIVPVSIFRSMGIGASLVVVFAVAATLTLVPAVLRLLGDRIESLSLGIFRRAGGGEMGGGRFWANAAAFVMRNAVIMAIGSAVLLITFAIPYFQIHLGASGTSSLPEEYEVRQAFDQLNREFVPGFISPTLVLIEADDVTTPAIQTAAGAFLGAIAQDKEIRIAGEPTISPDKRLGLVRLALSGDISSEQAQEQVHRLRDTLVPAAFDGVNATVYVGGETAGNVDFFALVERYTPIVFAYVLGLSFLLLMLVFRSLVVPLKSIIMNLLSVGAAYGVLVVLFQWGWGREWTGLGHVTAIEAWLPLMMFTILFGLSMDYHVFLISRIQERFRQTANNGESVAFGLQRTANIITGAAAIMVVVFGGFALGDLVMFQQLGVGLAVSVLLDATLVRTVLVPATMRLLGDRNWYLPSWLEWLPDLRVEGGHGEP